MTQRHVVSYARTVPLGLAAAQPPIVCADLGRIRVPTLLTLGAKTLPYYRGLSEAYVRCMPGSRLVTLADSNHDAPLRVPAQFNTAVMAFIAAH